MVNDFINKKFDNDYAYIAMELTKTWAIEKNKKYDNYINVEDIANAFNTIYKMIG
jgi:hypothetical protein